MARARCLRVVHLFVFVCLTGAGGGCRQVGVAMTRIAGPVEVRAQGDDEPQMVYVISNGFHAGLVLPQDPIDPDIWPEHERSGRRRWVEVGWGDEGFYRAEKITAGIVVDAIFPSPSVLHIVGFDRPIEECLTQGDLVSMSLPREQFDTLCRFIHDSYARNDEGEAISLGKGLYGDSRFYRARGNYYFPKTCNVWTAQALQTSGLPVHPSMAVTADGVLWQVRRFGETIRERP